MGQHKKKYIWIYSYPEIAVQNPVIQEHFPHILQFEDNFVQNFNVPLDPNEQPRRRGRRQGSRNRQDSWKNTAAPEWRPKSKNETPQDPESIASRTRSKQHVDQICSIFSTDFDSNDKPGPNLNWWSIVDYRRAQPKRASNPVQEKRGLCNGRKFSPCAHSNQSEQNFPSSRQSNGQNSNSNSKFKIQKSTSEPIQGHVENFKNPRPTSEPMMDTWAI